MLMKECNQYYFSVEGETEKWYLEHLQSLINKEEATTYKVDFKIKKSKSISRRAKSINAIYTTKAFHICDYESNEETHTEQFEKILKELKDVKKINNKLNYKLGYSNFSFELWIILHKRKQSAPVVHRKQYLKGINEAYNENFKSLDEYKHEDNFKKILSKITLQDVQNAITRGKEIREKHQQNDEPVIYGKFEYYKENPDMTINECIEEILVECGVLKF